MKLLVAILPTILLTTYCQIMVKWRVSALSGAASETGGPLVRGIRYLTDYFIVSTFIAAFLSAVAWFYVLERYPVSIAFPAYVGVLFAFVTISSALLLGEAVSPLQLGGLVCILAGVLIVSAAA